MALTRVMVLYLVWHYSVGLRDLLGVFKTFLWFFKNFFAFGSLLGSLFSPWRRLDEPVGSVFHFEQFAGNLVANFVTRIAGAIVKLIFISIGLAVTLGVSIFGLLFLCAWLLAPLLIVVLILSGLTFMVL